MLSAILADQPDDVLAELKRKLEKRIANARSSLTDAESELRLVEQALAAPRPDRPGAGGMSAPHIEVERDREPDGRFQGIPRARVLAVAESLPDPITPARVVEAFATGGEMVNIEQIRIALSRIAKDGNLTKIGPSLFTVPGRRQAETELPRQQTPPDRLGDVPDPFHRGVRGGAVSSDVFRRSF